jgi:phosphoribosylanthranilate isomerase
MIDGIRMKVCGLTSLVDADFADRCGADFLGFILHSKSPRKTTLDQYRAMDARLPERKRVAVSVEPSQEELAAMVDAGFDRFQIHFGEAIPLATVEAWSKAVGPDSLWLAPKLPPGREFPQTLLPLAATFLIDTFQQDGFGGSGKTGDWSAFSRLRASHPEKTWILAGGLNPANIGAALDGSGARFVDVNSGVEAAPGVKDHEKLKAFVVAVHKAVTKTP